MRARHPGTSLSSVPSATAVFDPAKPCLPSSPPVGGSIPHLQSNYFVDIILGRRAPPRDLRRHAGDGCHVDAQRRGDGGSPLPEPPLRHDRDGDPRGDRRSRPLARRQPRGLRVGAPQGGGLRDARRLAGGAGAEEGRRALQEARYRPLGPIPARGADQCANLTSERYSII